jgi:ketosteroid isomerase-like protein
MRGTLAQPFDTGSGVAQPGGRMEIDAVDVITVSDGELTAKHTYVDWATALRQMGIA